MTYVPPPGLRHPEGLISNPLISLSAPIPNKDGLIEYNLMLAGDTSDRFVWRTKLMKGKSLFINALIRIAKTRHYVVNPDVLFSTVSQGLMSSSTILCVRDQLKYRIRFTTGGFDNNISTSESTTRFVASFGFVSNNHTREYGVVPTSGVVSPLYSLDSMAIDIINSNSFGKEILPALMEDFWKLLAMAEHDYVHAMTLQKESISLSKPGAGAHHGTHYEMWSLALHAAACAELFKNKNREKMYLVWVGNYYEKLVNLQKAMGTDTAEKRDVITYLAEIAFHRVARVMAPDSKALGKSKAARLMNRLKLSPPRGYASNSIFSFLKIGFYERQSGVKKLWMHCAKSADLEKREYARIYKPIHDKACNFQGTIFDGTRSLTFDLPPIDFLVLLQQQVLGKIGDFQPFRKVGVIRNWLGLNPNSSNTPTPH